MEIFIARLGNPEITYELLEAQRINIGGYGLFY